MYKLALFVSVLVAVSALCPASPQPPPAYPAELALPFGVANGKVVVSGDFLIFVNDANVENSFVIPRENVQSLTSTDGMTTVAFKQSMRDQSGDRSQAIFRFANAADADSLTRWSKPTTTQSSTAPPADTGEPVAGQLFNYSVKHAHKLGSCEGRLMATSEKLIFESLTDVNDSRQWSMRDVKEVKRKNPYKLELRPFSGNDYSFEFLGKGMDNDDWANLSKLITGARARP